MLTFTIATSIHRVSAGVGGMSAGRAQNLWVLVHVVWHCARKC